ncbi:hypothetical protein ACMFMG_011397 [Clarireedia jacksonii]
MAQQTRRVLSDLRANVSLGCGYVSEIRVKMGREIGMEGKGESQKEMGLSAGYERKGDWDRGMQMQTQTQRLEGVDVDVERVGKRRKVLPQVEGKDGDEDESGGRGLWKIGYETTNRLPLLATSSVSRSSSISSASGDMMPSSQSTIMTIPDSPVKERADSKAQYHSVATSGVVKRKSLSREDIRQKAQTLRLRLSLAHYKILTDQIDIPFSELKHHHSTTNITKTKTNTRPASFRTKPVNTNPTSRSTFSSVDSGYANSHARIRFCGSVAMSKMTTRTPLPTTRRDGGAGSSRAMVNEVSFLENGNRNRSESSGCGRGKGMRYSSVKENATAHAHAHPENNEERGRDVGGKGEHSC